MIDITNASRTLLFNIHTREWDPDLLKLFEVPESMLPEVKPSVSDFGIVNVDSRIADIPICGVAGDQQSAFFGQACFKRGMAKCTYGTGCFLLLNTQQDIVHSQNRLLSTVAWQTPSEITYALEGSVFIGGAAIQWLRDGLKIIRKASDSEQVAQKVQDSDGVYLVPAFSGLGAPYWNPDARGMITGITRGTTEAHIVRATLDSIAFQVADLASAMVQDAKFELQELRVDGGASANNFLLQIQADLLGIPVVRPKNIETTALGAAYLAGRAVGLWNNQEEITHNWQLEQTFEPQISRDHAETLLENWHKAVNLTIQWAQ